MKQSQMPNSKKWTSVYYCVYAQVSGEVYADSGLGIHCDVDVMVEGLGNQRQWAVDHLPSGQAIDRFDGQARARVFIEEIATYTNWATRSVESLRTDEALWEKVAVAASVARQWKPPVTKKLYEMRQQVRLFPEREGRKEE